VSTDGRTEELRVDRTEESAEGVNGVVKVKRESLVECAFKEVAEADRRGNGEGVELIGSSLAGTLD
jgi:hypothetical protein